MITRYSNPCYKRISLEHLMKLTRVTVSAFIKACAAVSSAVSATVTCVTNASDAPHRRNQGHTSVAISSVNGKKKRTSANSNTFPLVNFTVTARDGSDVTLFHEPLEGTSPHDGRFIYFSTIGMNLKCCANAATRKFWGPIMPKWKGLRGSTFSPTATKLSFRVYLLINDQWEECSPDSWAIQYAESDAIYIAPINASLKEAFMAAVKTRRDGTPMCTVKKFGLAKVDMPKTTVTEEKQAKRSTPRRRLSREDEEDATRCEVEGSTDDSAKYDDDDAKAKGQKDDDAKSYQKKKRRRIHQSSDSEPESESTAGSPVVGSSKDRQVVSSGGVRSPMRPSEQPAHSNVHCRKRSNGDMEEDTGHDVDTEGFNNVGALKKIAKGFNNDDAFEKIAYIKNCRGLTLSPSVVFRVLLSRRA